MEQNGSAEGFSAEISDEDLYGVCNDALKKAAEELVAVIHDAPRQFINAMKESEAVLRDTAGVHDEPSLHYAADMAVSQAESWASRFGSDVTDTQVMTQAMTEVFKLPRAVFHYAEAACSDRNNFTLWANVARLIAEGKLGRDYIPGPDALGAKTTA